MQEITRLSKLPLKSLALAGLLALGSNGAWATYSCTYATPTPTFTTITDLFAVTDDIKLTVPFSMSCKKQNGRVNGRFCLRMGVGGAGTPAGVPYNDRWLAKGADYAGFQIYKNTGYSNIWGTDTTAPYQQIAGDLDMFGSTVFSEWPIALPQGGSYPLYLKLLKTFPTVAGVSDITMLPAGTYTSTFGADWRLSFGTGSADNCTGGSGENSGLQPITFTVTAKIEHQCKITADISDIDFGTQPGSATNLEKSTNLKVQCTNKTPYFIGLKPGNNDVNGAGVMLKGADQVAYQLRQGPGMSGAIWGNTAESGVVGNGVAGTGNGLVKDHTIYATVGSADAAVGSYTDSVLVTVHY